MPGPKDENQKNNNTGLLDEEREEMMEEIRVYLNPAYNSEYAKSFFNRNNNLFQYIIAPEDQKKYIVTTPDIRIKRFAFKLNKSAERDPKDTFTSEDYQTITNMIYDFEKLCLCAHYPDKMNSANEPGVADKCKRLGIDVIDNPYFSNRFKDFRKKYDTGKFAFRYFFDTMSELLDEGMKYNAYTLEEYRHLMGFAAAIREIGCGGEQKSDGSAYYHDKPEKYDRELVKKYEESLEKCDTYHPDKSIVLNTIDQLNKFTNAFTNTMNWVLKGTGSDADEFIELSKEWKFGRLRSNMGREMTLMERYHYFAGAAGDENDMLYYFTSNIGQLAEYANERNITKFNSLLNEMLQKYSYKDFAKTTSEYLDRTGIRFMYSEKEYKMILGAVTFFENFTNNFSKELAFDYSINTAKEVDNSYQAFEQKIGPKNATVDFLMKLLNAHNSIVRTNAKKRNVDDYDDCLFKMGYDNLYSPLDTFETAILCVKRDEVESLLDDYEKALDEAIYEGLSEGLEEIPDIEDFGIEDKVLTERFGKIREKIKDNVKNIEGPETEIKIKQKIDSFEVQALNSILDKAKIHRNQNETFKSTTNHAINTIKNLRSEIDKAQFKPATTDFLDIAEYILTIRTLEKTNNLDRIPGDGKIDIHNVLYYSKAGTDMAKQMVANPQMFKDFILKPTKVIDALLEDDNIKAQIKMDIGIDLGTTTVLREMTDEERFAKKNREEPSPEAIKAMEEIKQEEIKAKEREKEQQAPEEINEVQNTSSQAPKNIGPYSIKDGNIPFEIKISSDPEKIAKYYSDNRSKLNEAERNYLADLHNNAKYIEYLNDQKQYVQLKESKLVEENGTVLLPDITLNRAQDTYNGCWSCAFELLLQSKGIELDQKNIRSFRPNVNENIHIVNVEGLIDDKPFSIGEAADLVLDVLPNTAVRRKKFTADNINANVVQRLEKELISSIKEVITKHHTPVALTNGGHFITVVGVDNKGNLLCKDSYGLQKRFDPDYTYKINVSDYINGAVNNLGYVLFEMTHFEEVKLENEEIQNFKGTDLDSRIEYKDGKASLIDRKRKEAVDIPHITNVNGTQIGSSKNVEGVLIEDIAYLPNTLTVIQPKPDKIKPFNNEDKKIFDEPFGIAYNKQFDVIIEGEYEYGNLLALSKEQRKKFLNEIHKAVISQSQILKSEQEKRPELKKVYDFATRMLNGVENDLIECSTQGRISDKAIISARLLISTLAVINFASQKGNEKALQTISRVDNEYLIKTIDLVNTDDPEIKGLLAKKIGDVDSFGDLVKNSIRYSQELYKNMNLGIMASKLGGSREHIQEQQLETKTQVNRQPPKPQQEELIKPRPVQEEKKEAQVSVPIKDIKPQTVQEEKKEEQISAGPSVPISGPSVPISQTVNKSIKEEQIAERQVQEEKEVINEQPDQKEKKEAEISTDDMKEEQIINESADIKENDIKENILEEIVEQPIHEERKPIADTKDFVAQLKENREVKKETIGTLGRALTNIAKSASELEKAKTIVNSDEYKNLIKFLKDLQKPDALTDNNLGEKLSTVGQMIDSYINHKARDGVKTNTYHKLAAVQKANEWVSKAMGEIGLTRAKDYREVYEKENGAKDKNAPVPGDVDLSKVPRKNEAEAKTIKYVDDCICTIILRAENPKRENLKNVRNEFNKGVLPKVKEMGPAK